METTKKSINEQIEELHNKMDYDYMTTTTVDGKLDQIHHQNKVIIQHIMKLEAKCYFIQKKLDEALGLRPRT